VYLPDLKVEAALLSHPVEIRHAFFNERIDCRKCVRAQEQITTRSDFKSD
jgi:hypothetical protein